MLIRKSNIGPNYFGELGLFGWWIGNGIGSWIEQRIEWQLAVKWQLNWAVNWTAIGSVLNWLGYCFIHETVICRSTDKLLPNPIHHFARNWFDISFPIPLTHCNHSHISPYGETYGRLHCHLRHDMCLSGLLARDEGVGRGHTGVQRSCIWLPTQIRKNDLLTTGSLSAPIHAWGHTYWSRIVTDCFSASCKSRVITRVLITFFVTMHFLSWHVCFYV